MELSEDTFRALARSGPWRWGTAHLRHRDSTFGELEAWIRRPDWLLVRREGDDLVVRGGERTYAQLRFAPDGPTTSETFPMVWGGSLEPVYHPDGLVAERPTGFEVDFDDPMWQSYRWVAMLDPVELSEGVELADLRAGKRGGRATWFARAVAVEGYDPRCSCCPLLWGRISDDIEYGNGTRERYCTDYPAGYDIALDVQTGIVVEVRAVDGRQDLDFEVDILEVDADLTELIGTHPAPARS
ncbi:MAG: hypothetical protein ACXV4A_14495 [Actinomycetes bacterium]